MANLPVYNSEGKEVDSMALDAGIFDIAPNRAAIYQVVNAYRANQRKGMASTKTMGEVSGGGKKPWRQKGTGRARAGSIRSPLWRHGGVTFGPHPRDFSYDVPQKIRTLALKSALSVKIKENKFIVVEDFNLEKPKTAHAVKVFSNLKVSPDKSVLVLLDVISPNVKLALRNVSLLDFSLAKDTNAYEVMAHKQVVITKKALGALTQRLKK